MKIELEFTPEMATAVMEGRKCCTFRRDLPGDIGDTFEVGGHTYRIVQITQMRLAEAIYKFYGAEGFDAPDEMHEWATMQYGKGYDTMMAGYLHFFAPIPDALGRDCHNVVARLAENGCITLNPDNYMGDIVEHYRMYLNPATGVITLTPHPPSRYVPREVSQ